MNEFTESITSTDEKLLFTRIWEPEDGTFDAIVLVIHGMGEHSGRYHRLAEFLTQQKIAVAAYDHRGHGNTDPHHPGYIETDNGFSRMVSDIESVRKNLRKRYPNLPLVYFAHSMGSFLTQRHLQRRNHSPDGVIYSGSTGRVSMLLPLGILISALYRILRSDTYKSEFLRNMVFKPYNTRFKPVRTRHDWISRVPEEVDRYIDDPLCGFTPSVSFFNYFFKGLRQTQKFSPFAGTGSPYPVLIASGADDPISDMGKGVKDLEEKLSQSGISDLTVNIYPNVRHEVLSDLKREEIMQDILNWIQRIIV